MQFAPTQPANAAVIGLALEGGLKRGVQRLRERESRPNSAESRTEVEIRRRGTPARDFAGEHHRDAGIRSQSLAADAGRHPHAVQIYWNRAQAADAIQAQPHALVTRQIAYR